MGFTVNLIDIARRSQKEPSTKKEKTHTQNNQAHSTRTDHLNYVQQTKQNDVFLQHFFNQQLKNKYPAVFLKNTRTQEARFFGRVFLTSALPGEITRPASARKEKRALEYFCRAPEIVVTSFYLFRTALGAFRAYKIICYCYYLEGRANSILSCDRGPLPTYSLIVQESWQVHVSAHMM